MKLPRRAVVAATVLLLGFAFCAVMYAWQLRYPYAAHGFGLIFFAFIPFIGLAFLVMLGMGRVATSLGWLALAGLTGLAFMAAATSSSSTAALVWIAPFAYGAIALLMLYAADGSVRSWRIVRRAWTNRRQP